jgi:hypothetical protein
MKILLYLFDGSGQCVGGKPLKILDLDDKVSNETLIDRLKIDYETIIKSMGYEHHPSKLKIQFLNEKDRVSWKSTTTSDGVFYTTACFVYLITALHKKPKEPIKLWVE